MSKIIIFYWEPGSCGDFIHSLLLSRPLEYQGVVEQFTSTDQGRLVPELLQFFTENFDHESVAWYLRKWTVTDCRVLSDYVDQLNCDAFVLPTHQSDQVDFLQEQFPNSVTMGVTYPANMYPLVLKNWCKKVMPFDPNIHSIYNKPLHKYLLSKNSFGEFVLSEQLKYGTTRLLQVDKKFNIEISLEDLYNGNLSAITALFQDSSHVAQKFSRWIAKQSNLHQHKYNLPTILQTALGYNSKSTTPGNTSLELDMFDNILIKHYSTRENTPNFKTLQQAADFFNIQAETR